MGFDRPNLKAYVKCQEDCWGCMACVKSCPQSALSLRLSYQIADYKATLMPRTKKDHVIWTAKDIDGVEDVFVIKTRE